MTKPGEKMYDCAVGCPVEATLDLIDGKWKGVILYHLLDDTIRFNELRRRLSRITQRMLTRQLRELEAAGLIHREIFPEVPPRVEYSLTALGRSLEPVIRILFSWGDEYLTNRKTLSNIANGSAPTPGNCEASRPSGAIIRVVGHS